MHEDLKLFTKDIFIGFRVSSKPLVGHFVFNQHSVINCNGLTSHFESDIGVWMFKNPYGVKVLLEHKDRFLES